MLFASAISTTGRHRYLVLGVLLTVSCAALVLAPMRLADLPYPCWIVDAPLLCGIYPPKHPLLLPLLGVFVAAISCYLGIHQKAIKWFYAVLLLAMLARINHAAFAELDRQSRGKDYIQSEAALVSSMVSTSELSSGVVISPDSGQLTMFLFYFPGTPFQKIESTVEDIVDLDTLSVQANWAFIQSARPIRGKYDFALRGPAGTFVRITKASPVLPDIQLNTGLKH
jgi:hypothetical protein